jgi:hypothetical protein
VQLCWSHLRLSEALRSGEWKNPAYTKLGSQDDLYPFPHARKRHNIIYYRNFNALPTEVNKKIEVFLGVLMGGGQRASLDQRKFVAGVVLLGI